jgi:hypothetical protein
LRGEESIKIYHKKTGRRRGIQFESFNVILKYDFCVKKFEKCKMKMKKINPTPKSIIHKNPTKIFPSCLKSSNPNKSKYIPPTYHNDAIS